MTTMDRRAFVRRSLGAATAVAAPRRGTAAASEKVIIGIIGAGGRGTYLAAAFARRSDAEVAYVCDTDIRRASKAKGAVAEVQQREPTVVQDFLRVLEDRNVNAIVNAMPDHCIELIKVAKKAGS